MERRQLALSCGARRLPPESLRSVTLGDAASHQALRKPLVASEKFLHDPDASNSVTLKSKLEALGSIVKRLKSSAGSGTIWVGLMFAWL